LHLSLSIFLKRDARCSRCGRPVRLLVRYYLARFTP
jgi:ribosomal protein S14